MSSQHSENGIPILTEVIVTPVYGVDLPERRIAPQPPVIAIATLASVPVSPEVTGPPSQQGFVQLDDANLERIEREVAARVLQQLMSRVDFVLEQRIRDSLADVLQTAVDGLACQLRFGLKETLEDALTRAISQEIKKSQILK